MTRVLLVAPLPPPYGGITRWVLLLKDRLSADKAIELTSIINTAPLNGKAIGRSNWERIVCQGFDIFRLRKALNQDIHQRRPDVVHLTTSGSLSVIRDILLMKKAKQCGIPIVYHLHFGRIPQLADVNNSEWNLLKRAIRLSDATIAIDNATHEVLTKHFPTKSIYSIPNFLNTRSIRKTHAKNNKEIVFIGWCVKAKGIEELLASWEVLHKKYSEWTLRLVGPYEEGYIQCLKRRYSFDSITFEGEKSHDEAMSILHQAAIFTLPSHTEGFPNVVLEAMAHEKPIVATDVGAIAQMLEDGAGIIIPAKNTERLIEELDQLMANEVLRVTLGKTAKRKMEKQYTVDIVFEKLKKTWESVIE